MGKEIASLKKSVRRAGWWHDGIIPAQDRNKTPLLPWVLGLLGLAAVTGYLDYVLLPLLGIFLAIAIYAALIKRRTESRTRQP